jgi:hypothetical protein
VLFRAGQAVPLEQLGRIGNNRSWFGNLMHWREPYGIRAFLRFAGRPIGWGLILRKQ